MQLSGRSLSSNAHYGTISAIDAINVEPMYEASYVKPGAHTQRWKEATIHAWVLLEVAGFQNVANLLSFGTATAALL